MLIRVMLAAAIATLGCEAVDEDAGQTGDGGGVSVDGGLDLDGGAVDFDAPDGPPPPPCGAGVEGTFDIAPGEGTTQIHGDAVYTGDGLWFTFNREEEDGANFDVWATQIGCDGVVRVPPFRVTDVLGFNDVDPVIAATDDRVLVAWSRDSSGEQPNLSLLYRVYDRDGAPLTDERAIQTSLDGEPLVANHWLPAVTRLADGFAIAGSRGIAGMGFQTFVQRVDRDGEPFGDAVARVGQFGQVEPEIVADDAGRMYLAWTEQSEPEQVVHTTLAAAGDAFEPAPSGPFPGTSSTVRLSARGDARWIAASVNPGGGPRVGLLRGADFTGDPDLLLFGTPGVVSHSPTITADAEGGWIGWYQIIRGFQNEVWIGRFAADPRDPVAAADPVKIETDAPAAPYALVVVDVGPGVALVAWHEGQSPNFTLKGRFVRRD